MSRFFSKLIPLASVLLWVGICMGAEKDQSTEADLEVDPTGVLNFGAENKAADPSVLLDPPNTLPPISNSGNYSVKEFPGGLELRTPFGEVWIPGEFNEPSYRFSIPLEELKASLTKPAKEDESKPKDPSESPAVSRSLTSNEAPPSPQGKFLVEYDDTAKLVVEANRLYNRKRYFESLSVVDEILRKRPDFTRAWIMKGSLLKMQGYPDLARNAWEHAQKLNPEDPNIQRILEVYR